MIHTDRGAAYTSTNYNEALRQEKVRHSLSAPETPANNAVMEHWWADFKSIWLEHRPKAQTLAELQEQVRAGIMYFTNQFISTKEMTKPWRNITTIWLDKKNCVFVFISVNLTGIVPLLFYPNKLPIFTSTYRCLPFLYCAKISKFMFTRSYFLV